MITDKQLFAKRIRKFLDILEYFSVYWYDFNWEDEFLVEIVMDNYTTIYIQREPSSIITYDVGYIKESGGSYWEPPDYDYVSTLNTNQMNNAIAEVLIIPKRGEILNEIESLQFHDQIMETIFDKD